MNGCGSYGEAAEHLKPVLLVASCLGMRYSEIVRLTWNRADRERGLMTLWAITTKTKQPRQVPMTADVLAALKELHKVRYLGQDRVFLPDGKLIKTALEKAKSLRRHQQLSVPRNAPLCGHGGEAGRVDKTTARVHRPSVREDVATVQHE